MEPDLIDARCDVYAIGVIFYELLTGKLPYASKTVRGLLRDTLEARPIPLADAAPGKVFDERVERFLFRLLEKDTEVRYQTADQALAALAECKAPAKPPEPEKKPGFFARLFGGLFGGKK
jgi:serine/threonine-protein kinase